MNINEKADVKVSVTFPGTDIYIFFLLERSDLKDISPG